MIAEYPSQTVRESKSCKTVHAKLMVSYSEMDNEKKQKIPHCLVLPFPLQGHVNPMLQFSKRLSHRGIAKITLVVTKFFFKSVENFPADGFPVETISDGFDDGGAEAVSPKECLDRMWKAGSESFLQLLEKLRSSSSHVDCVIYDPFYPWVFDVAEKFGLMTAIFFTQSNSVNSIYFNAYRGELQLPVVENEIRIPGGLTVLKRTDLPSFIVGYESDRVRCEAMVNQFRNVERVDWIFVNTFYHLEQEVTDWMAKFLPVRTIGPTIPSMYLDKRIPNDKEYGFSVFTPITDPCMKWLDEQQTRSVIYVSFGSFARPSANQMKELALALKFSNLPFLWIVRALEEAKLPENYKDEISEKGLIVTWCPQLQVLAHEAIGCFITHCGWNSTLEALSSGVPIVAIPQWSDQSTNAKFVGDVWKMGIRGRSDEEGIVRQAEILDCIKHVMEGETGEEVRKSSRKWKELSREAVEDGGSSDKNIQDFISALSLRS